jgi:hypothetical protein
MDNRVQVGQDFTFELDNPVGNTIDSGTFVHFCIFC